MDEITNLFGVMRSSHGVRGGNAPGKDLPKTIAASRKPLPPLETRVDRSEKYVDPPDAPNYRLKLENGSATAPRHGPSNSATDSGTQLRLHQAALASGCACINCHVGIGLGMVHHTSSISTSGGTRQRG